MARPQTARTTKRDVVNSRLKNTKAITTMMPEVEPRIMRPSMLQMLGCFIEYNPARAKRRIQISTKIDTLAMYSVNGMSVRIGRMSVKNFEKRKLYAVTAASMSEKKSSGGNRALKVKSRRRIDNGIVACLGTETHFFLLEKRCGGSLIKKNRSEDRG